MLDLFISYINFAIAVINLIIGKLTFQPPNPPGYIIEKTRNKKEIFFITEKDKQYSYERKSFKDMEIKYIYLNHTKPLKSEFLLFKPKNHFPICIIYCHGNCGDLGYALFECFLIAKNTNCLLLCFEYPGYGTFHKIKIHEKKFYQSVQKAYIYAKNVLNFEEKNIFLYGFSLGTGIALDLACRETFPISGLILQSPYLSIMRIVYNMKKTFFLDIFANCDKIKKLKVPTLFIHGTDDNVVPYIHGRILAKLLDEKYLYSFLTINDGGHNNLFHDEKDKEIIFEKIKEFISDCSGIDIKNNYNISDNSDINDKKNSLTNEDNISYERKSQNTLDKSIFTENRMNKRIFMIHNKNIKSDINFSYKDDSIAKFESNNSNSNSNSNYEALSIDNLFEKEKKGLKNTIQNNRKRNEKYLGKYNVKENEKNENYFMNKSFSMFNMSNKYYNEEIDKLKNKK